MADDERDEDDAVEVDPAAVLLKVEKQAALNKYLLIATLVIAGIVFTVMATGLTVMYLQLSSLSETLEQQEDETLDEQFLALEEQLILLADFRKSELRKITTYTSQLEKISQDCSLEKAAPYRDFLSSREKDFQSFLSVVKSGTNNLANMNKGSRGWLEVYNKELDDLQQQSATRQNTLDKLMRKSGG